MFQDFKFGTDLWDPSHRFQTSWLLPPYVLFACRALFATYAFFVLFFLLGWNCTHIAEGYTYKCEDSRQSFSYFTDLTYWGIAFYEAVAAFHTFCYARWNRAPLDSWPRPLQALHAFFYTTVTCFPFLVTIVYWGLLYSHFDNQYEVWSNTSQHALNSFFALFEVVIPRTAPAPLIHMLWLIVLLALYLCVAFITYAAQGFFVYSFLDYKKKHALVAAYVFGIGVAILIIFLIVQGIVWLRKWATEKKLGMDGKFANGSNAIDNWSRPGTEGGRDIEMDSSTAITEK